MAIPYLDTPVPYAFAHRGGGAERPENTWAAFEHAVQLGIVYIETDVMRTRDGRVVIHHDDTLERTTNGRGPVSALTLAELHKLDAGFHFAEGATFPYRNRGEKVPELAATLERFPGVRFTLEMKGADPALPRLVWEIVERLQCHDRVLIASADDESVRAFQKLSKGSVAISAGQGRILSFWVRMNSGLARLRPIQVDAFQVPATHKGLRIITRRFVRAAHLHGAHVQAWTINDVAEMHRLLDLGVDAIMTDYPTRLLQVLAERA